jgi:uncharacterized damage-inducible protein DinB
MLTRTLVILATASLSALAQTQKAPATQKSSSGSTNVDNARMLWSDQRDNITQSAADVPESLYSFRPTPDVRTFGELIGHIAGSQQMYCAMALGEKPPGEDDVEKTAKTKAALVQALKASNDYCARAYKQTDAATTGVVDLFGSQRTRLFVLFGNAAHDAEHYGNIVTYMRINKMVPPSSRPRPPGT